MPKFLCRANIEYSTEVEAETEEEALETASHIDFRDWDQCATSETTAEKVEVKNA